MRKLWGDEAKVYRDELILKLIRTGSHSDLFV